MTFTFSSPVKNVYSLFSCFAIFLLTLCTTTVLSQDKITLEDYERSARFSYNQLVNKKVFNMSIDPHWLPSGNHFWYKHFSTEGSSFILISVKEKEKSPLFDHEKLAEVLSKHLNKEIIATNLPIRNLEFVDDNHFRFNIDNQRLILDVDSYTLTENKPSKEESETLNNDHNKYVSFSSDSLLNVQRVDYNLSLKNLKTNTLISLSSDGSEQYQYASWYGWGDIMYGEQGKRPDRFAVNWSKDNAWIHVNICDTRTADKMYLLNSAIDSLYRPQLLSYYRGSPGDTTMVYQIPVFFNTNTGKRVDVPLKPHTHINQINSTWSNHSGIVYLTETTRGFKELTIYRFNLNTEELTKVYSEKSTTNIDNFSTEWVFDEDILLYLSEKEGWRQLYKIDLTNGNETKLTEGNYYIQEILEVDTKSKTIYFTASGKEQGAIPYYHQLYMVKFNGKGLKTLTAGNNEHHTINLSPNLKYFVDQASTVQKPTQVTVRSTNTGKELMTVTSTTLKDLDKWEAPEIFSLKARDGKTNIYGALWKPVDFDPKKKYPLLEYSYTGPHTHVFPTSFSGAFRMQSMAELGFIVMVVDGLGSSGRSKAFHDYSYKNLGGNLADHVKAISWLGKNKSWIDTSRVGIFGHSAGGYDAAHALLAYPDTYHVAVASSADHDHRMEKAWWPEMYMGWPVDSAYHLQSNITMAPNLKGKLLITHGGIDENVNPSATFKFADALIQANKPFDMLILPSQRHGYRGVYSDYFNKVRMNYFLEHLRGVEPLWDIED